MSRGRFLTFEGGEGAGKSTLIQSVASYLTQQGQGVVCTREPGGTKAAEEIRDLVVTGAANRWDAVSETALFLTARRSHVEELISPALTAGKTVLCDRFADSTLVYQGIAKKLGMDYVQQLSALIVGDVVPDRTFLIDIDPKIGLARAGGRSGNETRFETHGIAFHQAIRDGFLSLAKQHPERMLVIDGSQSAEVVFKEVEGYL